VERLIRSSPQLKSRVTLLGRLSRDKVRLILSAADIFASASRREGSGYAALEAMACGAVPVLSDIPSFRAMTGDGTVGLLFPAGDAEALGRTLEDVSREAECIGWPRMRDLVLRHFRGELGVKALGRKAAAAYRQAAGEPSLRVTDP